MRYRSPRARDGDHLDWIRELPCIVCADDTATEAAHIRFADRSVAKRQTGMAEKPDDAFSLPMCGRCHRGQHGMNEREFWRMHGIDPIKVALALYYWSGDADACAMILAAVRDQSALALTGD